MNGYRFILAEVVVVVEELLLCNLLQIKNIIVQKKNISRIHIDMCIITFVYLSFVNHCIGAAVGVLEYA